MEKQPEALRLAESISRMDTLTEYQRSEILRAADELRRLHDVNQELLEVLVSFTKSSYIKHEHPKRLAKAIAAIAKAEAR